MQRSLESLEGVKHVRIEGDENGNHVNAMVEIAQGLDLRARIAARIVNHGFDLLELRAINLSLEDIFMQLTTEEKVEGKAVEKTVATAAETTTTT